MSEHQTPRTDAGSRAIMDRLKEMSARMEHFEDLVEHRLEERCRSLVSWPGLAGTAVGFLGVVFVATAAITSPTKEAAAQTRTEVAAARKELVEEVRELKREFSAKVDHIDARVEGLFRVNVEGRPAGPVRAEVERRTGAIQ